MKMRNILTVTIAIFLFGAVACNGKSEQLPPTSVKPKGIPVDAYVIQPEVLESDIVVAGTLLPFEETVIYPEVAGKITMLAVKEGAWVSKGTLLARLFDGDLRAQLHKLKVQLDIARKTRERQQELLKIGGISQQDFDLSVLNVNTIEADIAILNTDINKTYIRAPFNGRLGFKNVSIGAYITPQTAITTISQTGKLKLEFSVPERYAPEASLGKKVSFITEVTDGHHTATIFATQPTINEANRSLAIHALVNNNSGKLKAGSFARINFDLKKISDAIMIPTQAIIPEARDKKVIIYENGLAKFEVVETGVRDSSKIQILSGLGIGDTVITTGLLSIRPGSHITLSRIQNAAQK